MSEKHTPGPWHVVMSDNATPFIQHECGDDWTDIDDRTSRVCHMPAEIMENFNSLNNAKLIAAAPDLLAALETARDYVAGELEYRKQAMAGYPDKWRTEEQDLAAIDAAISKARGAS